MFLNCHSYHSLRYGTIPVDELVQLGVQCGASALALTDINASAGVFNFVKACQESGIKPLVGIEFRKQNKLIYVAIAKNKEGFAEMCGYLSKCNIEKVAVSDFAPDFKNVFVIYPLEHIPEKFRKFECIGIRPHEITQLIQAKWQKQIGRMVILQTVTYRTKQEFNLHKILRAVDLNIIGSRLSAADHCRKTDVMVTQNTLENVFKEFPQIIQQTESLVKACNFEFDFKSPKNKRFYTDSRESDMKLLTKLAYDGIIKRYGQDYKTAFERVERELKVIDDLGFSAYFLITWDIVQFSISKGFLHVGRGSGANSIVSYCLGITEICPIELDLYFERFLNPSRSSPPDFDIDWAWTDRDTILEYIVQRFGKDYVAFTGTTVEFKYRSIFRELGKVFGLPKSEIDDLAKLPIDQHDKNKVVQQIQFYGKMLAKYPNQRSMHSCGILISEEPITNYMVLEMPPKGFPTAQINMHDVEAIGFEKFDILSQRGIGHINDTVRLIEQNRGEKVDIRNIALSKDEKRANECLKQGNTIGCFYIESPAMRGLLRRLQCESYKVLVAASSVIRPGVAKSGMMAEYIFRHRHPDQFEYFHPVFKEHLGETYGVMVYQEDVIKIAHHFAGIDLAQADILRRAMSGKTRSKKELDNIKETYFSNCRKKGYSDQLSQEVYRQIESFAGYSFCKAHSASYAVESYQSLYLKTYYPIEFMVAVIINEGGFYRTEVYVHEAKMAGAIICNPCVNRSEYYTTLYGKEVYLGFRHLYNLGKNRIGDLIPEERKANGEYKSLEDFIQRIPIGIESLQILIFIGAFRFTGKAKNELILQARMLLMNFKPEDRNVVLFQEPTREYKLPKLERSFFEDAFDEIELLSFPVSCSPFDLLKAKSRGNAFAKDLPGLHKKQVKMVGYLISIKEVPIERGKMRFGTWVDSEGEYFDTTHWPESLKEWPFKGGGCYVIVGTVEVQFDFPNVMVAKMTRLPFIPDPRYTDNKDKQYRTEDQLKSDISATQRAPYPTAQEIGLPRYKMK